MPSMAQALSEASEWATPREVAERVGGKAQLVANRLRLAVARG